MPRPLAPRRSPRDAELAALMARLTEAEETLDAIRSGHVDALVVSGPGGDRIFTLHGGDHRYRRLVETMNEGAASITADGSVLYCNARFADLVGAPLDRIMGTSLDRFIPATSRTAFEALLRSGEGGRARAEIEMLTAAGATVPVYLSITANAAGEDPGFCLIATDLTEQKRNEETAAAGHIAASILEQTAEAIVVCDDRRRIVRASRAAHQLAGEELLDRPFETVFPLQPGCSARDQLSPADMLDAALRGCVVRGIEATLSRPSASPVSLLLSAGPLLNAQDEIVGCVVSLTDITERTQAEQERARLLRREQAARAEAEALTAQLRASEERMSLLANASATLAASLDYPMTLHNVTRLGVPALADWCCVYLLDEAQKLELVDISHREPEKTDALRAAFERYGAAAPQGVGAILRSGASRLVSDYTEEVRRAAAQDGAHLEVLRAAGATSWMAVPLTVQRRTFGVITFGSCDPVRRYGPADLALAEELAGRAAVAIDNARLFEAARRERARVEEANRAKDVFLATVSHELRTPLNAIMGWSRMLRSGSLSPEKRERALETVERNARMQTELIEDLLDISRIVSGKLRLTARPLDPCEIIESAVEASRLAAEARSIRLETFLDRTAGPIVGDPDRILQVVSNLLTNAIKFTPKGGRVEVRLAHTDEQIEIAVADTGQGIRPEFLPYVFDRFRQADGAITRTHGGLGLGLAISRHLVELHGGAVEAHSDGEGLGATFVVRLPTTPPRDTPTEAVSLMPVPKLAVAFEAPTQLAGLKVLVVDDEPDARELLVAVLERCNVEVTAAASADEALELLQRTRPDVLLSDIAMPGSDGYALIQRVRELSVEQGGRTPAAALTAFARMEDRTRALLAGYQMHVAKPIEPAELVVVIANLAGRLG